MTKEDELTAGLRAELDRVNARLAEQKRPQNCGTGYCSCVECVVEPAPVQEPVAWMYESVCGNDFATRHDPPDYAKNIRPLYITPPAAQRQWVGLTDEEVMQTMSGDWTSQFYFARSIEAKLREKNGGAT
jgi:hypothetical protein